MKDDVITRLAFRCAVMTLPFITLGMMDIPVVGYVAGVVGAIAMIVALAGYAVPGLFGKLKCADAAVEQLFNEIMTLPYVLALTGVIMQAHGIDATIAYCMSLFFFVLDVAGFIARKRRQQS